MKESLPYVITISRMLGSGGLIIGKQLSEKLGIAYYDREILASAADRFGLSENDLKNLDERPATVWERFLQSGMLENPDMYMEPLASLPSDRQLFEAVGEIIKNIADNKSAVIIGRGGSHILKKHPRHVSVFLHCSTELRVSRIKELFKVSEKDARKMISVSDSNRSRYNHLFTGKEWTDAREFTLCLDTGAVSLDDCADLIIGHVEKNLK